MVTLAAKITDYSQATGPVESVLYPCAASVAFKYLGAKFVTLDAAEQVALSVAGDTRIHGWAFVGEFTTNATAGIDYVTVNVSREAKYWVPTSTAPTRDAVGKTCDLVVQSGLQKANIGASTTDVLYVHDVDIVNSLALVSIYDTAVVGVV